MPDPDPSSVAYEPPDPERPASSAPTEPELETEAWGAAPAEHDPYAALRFSDYRLYMAGWILSTMGQQLQSVAVAWEIFQRTHKAITLGWVGLVQAAPVVVLALPAGHLADRFDRKRIMMLAWMIAAVCSCGLAALSYYRDSIAEPHWLVAIYGVLLVGAIAAAIGGPARSAFLPQIVPTWAFSNAVTWNSSFFQIAAVAGPAIGGAVIAFHVWPAYALDAVFAVIFVSFLAFIPPRHAPRSRDPATLHSLIAGIDFVWRTKIVLATITLDLFAVLLGGATFLLPIFATDVLHVGSVGYGWLRAAPAVGAFVMAMLVAHTPPMKKAGRAMLLAVAGFGAATIVFGLSKNIWLSMAMLFLVGAFDNISVVVRHTLVQVLTPDIMRGRVSAVNNVFIGASNELGGLESGLTAAWFGAVPSVVFGGLGTIIVVVAVALIWPQVRAFGSLRDAVPEPVIEPPGFPVIQEELEPQMHTDAHRKE